MYENWIVSLHSSLYRRKTDHSSVTRSPRVFAVDYLPSQLWMSYRIRHAREMLEWKKVTTIQFLSGDKAPLYTVSSQSQIENYLGTRDRAVCLDRYVHLE